MRAPEVGPAGGRVRRVRPAGDGRALMAREVREGLRLPLPTLPCKYFYDDRGCRLFDEITRLPEYYQTRTEEKILEGIAEGVVATARPRELVELGSGAGRKIRLLLDAAVRGGRGQACRLLDINESFLTESVDRLAAAYPSLEVEGIVGDFLLDLPAIGVGPERLLLFFAGTIGNLHPDEVPAFFRAAASTLTPGGRFLLGVDLVKDKGRLEAAYNDAAGVTALFNLNILQSVNEQLGADFDLAAFEHVAFYDEGNAWIEMRLRAKRATRVRIPTASVALGFAAGDQIRTELSCKYTRASLERRLDDTGLRLEEWFTDEEELFALALLERR